MFLFILNKVYIKFLKICNLEIIFEIISTKKIKVLIFFFVKSQK